MSDIIMDQIAQDVRELLRNNSEGFQQFMDAELFTVGKETIQKLKKLEKRAVDHLVGSGMNEDEIKNPLYSIVKIVNHEIPAYKFNLKKKHKYKNISDPEKVHKAIPREFEIWKNKKKKSLDEYIEKEEISEELAAKMKKDLEQEIEIDKQNLDKVMENYDDYSVIIARYKDLTYYPTLYYTTTDKKSHDTHLRANVPNVLYFDDNDVDGGKRSDSKIDKIVKTHHSFCDSIFYKKK